MTKGKSHCRRARRDIVRGTAANARRRARQQARKLRAMESKQREGYDRQQYDGSQNRGEETPLS